ncbi:MAG: DUF2269 family protein, partial [Candidatus Eiseniibacteriota bacterium]
MSDPAMTLMYPMFKTLHVLSAVAFLGNITTGLYWKQHADRSRDARLVRHMLEGLIGADRWFTIPGVLGLV